MENKVPEQTFRVKTTTSPPELGSAIAHAISAGNEVILKAVGAGAVNQAVKAVPIAQSYVISYGVDLVEKITFFHAHGRAQEVGLMGVSIRIMPA